MKWSPLGMDMNTDADDENYKTAVRGSRVFDPGEAALLEPIAGVKSFSYADVACIIPIASLRICIAASFWVEMIHSHCLLVAVSGERHTIWSTHFFPVCGFYGVPCTVP
jgi:hypothetical protein